MAHCAAAWPSPPLPLFASTSPAQWQQHMFLPPIARDRPDPLNLPESRLLALPARSANGDEGWGIVSGWAAGGAAAAGGAVAGRVAMAGGAAAGGAAAGGAAAVLLRVLDTAAAEGRLRPAEAAAARGALAALLYGL